MSYPVKLMCVHMISRGSAHQVYIIGHTDYVCLTIYLHHWCCEFESRSLCDKVCQWLVAGQWFSPGTPVFSTNKTDCYAIAEMLLKVASNTSHWQEH